MFTPLNYPFSGLAAGAIANILVKAIELVGLGGQGYIAKSYRPTGATVTVEGNLNPDSIRGLGRWKNKGCFEDHYVHSMPDASITDIILML